MTDRPLPGSEGIALMLSIIVPSALAALGTELFSATNQSDYIRGVPFFVAMLIGLLPASFGCCFIGLPIHYLLQRFRWSSQWTYALAGLVGSAIYLGGISLLLGRVPEMRQEIDVIFLLSITAGGPIAALTFWRIARPDRAIIVASNL